MSENSEVVFLGGHEAWDRITDRVAAAKKSPVLAAVAFIGVDAPAILPLKCGDVLVCDAEISRIKSGATSVKALRQFHERGVEVYDSPGLHAKVVVLKRRVFVGSGNASANSRDRLNEACIETTDSTAIRRAKKFVLEKTHPWDLLDEKQLKVLNKYERDKPPRGGRGVQVIIPVLPTEGEIPRVWIDQTEPYNADHLVESAEEDRSRIRRGAIRAGAGDRIDWDVWEPADLEDMRKDDWLVRVHSAPGKRVRVYAPVRIVGFSQPTDDESLVWHATPADVHQSRSLNQMRGTVVDRIDEHDPRLLVPKKQVGVLLDRFRK